MAQGNSKNTEGADEKMGNEAGEEGERNEEI